MRGLGREARSLQQSGVDLHALTGVPVHPMTPLAKLLWFARHEPETLATARWWVGLKEYLLSWLTGGLQTELSSASGTGLLDMKARTWSATAIELAGVLARAAAGDPAHDFPAATRFSGGAAGGPPSRAPRWSPARPTGRSAISEPERWRPGLIGLSLGTSGAVRMAVPEPSVDSGRTLFCYALTDTVWVTGGAI